MRVAAKIVLSEAEEAELELVVRSGRTEVRMVCRAQIVLLAAKGKLNQEIATELGISENKAGRWRARFAKDGLPGVAKDLPRGGRRRAKGGAVESLIIERTTQTKPANATHWSIRSLAKELDVSTSMVQRVWKANGLKPHLIKTFKISNDPRFEEKLRDVVGLYLNPPENAIVFSADEKTSIQALDRSQPGLPIVKGRCGTTTHDYKRNGTTTLFAAISMVCGMVIGTCMNRHRHQEWIKFLKLIDKQTDSNLEIHLIVDNYATHKHAKVIHSDEQFVAKRD